MQKHSKFLLNLWHHCWSSRGNKNLKLWRSLFWRLNQSELLFFKFFVVMFFRIQRAWILNTDFSIEMVLVKQMASHFYPSIHDIYSIGIKTSYHAGTGNYLETVQFQSFYGLFCNFYQCCGSALVSVRMRIQLFSQCRSRFGSGSREGSQTNAIRFRILVTLKVTKSWIFTWKIYLKQIEEKKNSYEVIHKYF